MAPSFVQSVDLDELYDNPDTGEALDTSDALTESFDSGKDGSSSISDLLAADDVTAIAKDVVMVVDNSGSMKKNDPDFLATRAVSEFISGLDAQTRIAIIIFDQDVSLAVPLTYLTLETRETVLGSLEKVNYRGLFTDIPAAIERAIYELKNNGRKDVQQSIVFMTDGIVDTGKANVDLEKSKWLKEELAADAADESIKIFGIAFTEAADFQLIQSIAQTTDGEYYRALQASDLQRVFKQIKVILNGPPEPAVVTQPDTGPQPPALQPAPVVQQPVIIEVPAQPQSMGKEERVRSTIMIVAAAVLFITLLAIVYLMLRRGRDMAGASNEVVTDAFLNDTNNYTGCSQYQLGQKPTMFGRVAGKDTEHLNFLVIPESTIGRRHALIEYKDYGFWISDQGSINGTFVNDKLLSSEVCLKHGDKIRLHKFEFEFVMPEMDDAGMTVVSNTSFTGQPDNADAATVLQGTEAAVAPEDSNLEPEFDITGGPEPDFDLDMGDEEDEEETIIRGDSNTVETASETDPGEEDNSEDETLIPGSAGLQEDQTSGDTSGESTDESPVDETLMRGNFDAEEDEDVTIRKEVDAAMEDFFDIGTDTDNRDTNND